MSVSKVAVVHGFWDFGRFAMRDKQIFGETPSQTPRRAKRDLAPPSDPLSLR